MKIDNKSEIKQCEWLISVRNDELKALNDGVKSIQNRKTSLWLDYHKELIRVDFYKRYQYRNNNATKLSQIFYLSDYQLPYSDHSEGDYVKINFSIKNDCLELNFYCTYYDNPHKNRHLISIPLDLFINGGLEDFLDGYFSDEDKKSKEKQAHNDAVTKKIKELETKIIK